MLTGSSPVGLVAMLEGLGVDVLGLNCGLGPKQMKPIIQSFSNRESVAESFASWGYNNPGVTSIKFVVSGNKTAAGVQHISHFGTRESEVLSPAGQEFKVLRVAESTSRWGGRELTFYVEDAGKKKRR